MMVRHLLKDTSTGESLPLPVKGHLAIRDNFSPEADLS